MFQSGRLKKKILMILGSLCVGLGIVGIFIPILPTTPFLLLAAYLYTLSSQRFLNWLLTNRLFGRYISNYRNGLGLPLLQKAITIFALWLTIGVSATLFAKSWWLRGLLLVIALAVSIHLVCIKTYRPEPTSEPDIKLDIQPEQE